MSKTKAEVEAAIRVQYWASSERRYILTNYSIEKLREVIQEVVRISPLLARLSEPVVSVEPVGFNFDTPQKWSALDEPIEWRIVLRWDDNMACIHIGHVWQAVMTSLGFAGHTIRRTKIAEKQARDWFLRMKERHPRESAIGIDEHDDDWQTYAIERGCAPRHRKPGKPR